ncbi:phytanoyl-CoA dioxygenase family protein [Pseudobacter ginsenosidimutans]|uniref:Ectoine hydroxylase-related dioxygenase (Phytanoyl-CoA dioxygenase family) n=1 Tax=Pseudobacter ginsenosidimutans TaxID=661488 RepID=A0A4Q7MLM1_9BACT|nr:phytanoyl-CoA dioxygenase family protein [Pseudobacter ginsenosidimutans]QEC45812.1 phytanoyl-CoA dioxygenase family protein [Pseudobacter ginsenosidimutans]RZS69234.1 ectoine hydroxylase-related dioxygenase (phytanoyl-CoA dioxygenase family) [Pseudobacter ginsenosidimutans]
MRASTNKVFYLGENLSREQLDFFNQYGFIHFRNFIDKETLHRVLQEVNDVQEYLISNNIDKVNGIPLKFGQDTDGKLLIQRIAFASQYSRFLSGLLKDPRFSTIIKLLSPFKGRIGEFEKDGLVVNHYVNTVNSAYNRLGWHTDSPRDLFLGSRILPMLNVGLHLDNCPFENGGLRVLPGTHTQNLFRLLFRKKYFIDNRPDKNEVGFDIQAGDLTVHDGRLWHRVQQSAFEGEASRRRVIYIPIVTGAYQPKDANSATPFYHKLAKLKKNPNGRINWSLSEGKTAVAQKKIA